jgi:hypothetical protein
MIHTLYKIIFFLPSYSQISSCEYLLTHKILPNFNLIGLYYKKNGFLHGLQNIKTLDAFPSNNSF